MACPTGCCRLTGRHLVPVIGTVALRDVDWHYRDQATGRATSIALAHLTVDDVGNVARLDGEGTWDGRKIGAKGEFGTLAQALNPTRPFPIDLSVSLPALELALQGTVADPLTGRGLDVRLTGQSDRIEELLKLLGSDLPLVGHLDGAARLSGDPALLRLSDLHLAVSDNQNGESRPSLEVTGQIETIRPEDAVPLEGIDCKVQLATSTAVLPDWLQREVPDLGPVQGRFALTGSSQALKLADLDLRVGSADQLTIAATGAVGDIQLAPELAVQGIDLHLEAKAPATAPLAKLLDRPLPELGPIDARFALTGNAEALKLADLDLQVGSSDQLTIAATGAVDEIQLRPSSRSRASIFSSRPRRRRPRPWQSFWIVPCRNLVRSMRASPSPAMPRRSSSPTSTCRSAARTSSPSPPPARSATSGSRPSLRSRASTFGSRPRRRLPRPWRSFWTVPCRSSVRSTHTSPSPAMPRP